MDGLYLKIAGAIFLGMPMDSQYVTLMFTGNIALENTLPPLYL